MLIWLIEHVENRFAMGHHQELTAIHNLGIDHNIANREYQTNHCVPLTYCELQDDLNYKEYIATRTKEFKLKQNINS